MDKNEMHSFLLQQGFLRVRQLADDSWIGILQLAFTTSVCMDIDEVTPFRYRWCFADPAEANHFFETAVDYDEVPAKRSTLKGHRYRGEPLLREKDEFGFNKW
ncbi:hypothetical protein ACUARP_004551 [Klebsiella pneumoniae]|uniref:hypothetical protein n=1 Tax=Klebsiella pneumoniae TaxID=573 RepID=UPI00065149DA|nr:hypothetical protein [Klebsiella pneumoniae]MCM6238509.1 hypothetical protein [Klebsiella pneumoniae]